MCVMTISLGTLEKYVRSRSLSLIPPLSPLFALLRFRFWLELTLSPLISVLVKFRENKLILSTSIIG